MSIVKVKILRETIRKGVQFKGKEDLLILEGTRLKKNKTKMNRNKNYFWTFF